MGVIEVTYYQAVCDACDANLSDDGEYSAWAADSGALDSAEDYGAYVITRGKGNPMTVVCEKCMVGFVGTCTDEEQDAILEHTPEIEAAITEWAAAQLRMAKAAE